MGSFDMNASFSKMPLLDEATVIICLKRKIDNKYRLIPLSYPIYGHYFDYGEVHEFQENEITKSICDFFEISNINDVIKFIYDMTIHGDYEDGLRGEFYRQEEKDRFDKYVSILDKLRKNSGIVIKTEDEIIQAALDRQTRMVERWQKCGKTLPTNEVFEKLTKKWIDYDIQENKIRSEMLESYELALFYENTPLFNALCEYPQYDSHKGTAWIEDYSDNLDCWSQYQLDKTNYFYITKDCNSSETIELKKMLKRLWTNFQLENKAFVLEETYIMGQEDCQYMWYKYSKAAHEMWKNKINKYSCNGDYKVD